MTREEAIKMLKSKMDGHTDTSYEWCECVRMAIKALEQEPKTGKWINNRNGTFTCDQCGCKHSNAKYCPNCGTKMEVSE